MHFSIPSVSEVKKRRLQVFLFILLLLSACHNADPTIGTTSVSGQVVVYQTSKGVPNASVQVYHASSGGGYIPVGSPYPADANGNFAFSFEARYASDYLLLANAPPGYITDWVLAPELKAGRKNENIMILTYAPAWVKIRLANDSGRKRQYISITGYSGSGEMIRYPRDTVFVRPILSGFRTAIAWGIQDKETSAYSEGSQYVQPSSLDTVAVRIPF